MTPEPSHPTPEELFAYRDGELPADRRSVIEVHVSSCRLCRGRIDRVSGLEAALKQRPDPVEGDYYAALSRSVLRKIGAREPAPREAPSAPPAVERPAQERRREAETEEPRVSRAPRLPWAAVLSTMAAAAAVLVVVVILVRQGAVQAPAPPRRTASSARVGAAGPESAATAPSVPPPAGTRAGAPGAPEAPLAAGPGPAGAGGPGASKKAEPEQVALGTAEEASPGAVANRAETKPGPAGVPAPAAPERAAEGTPARDQATAQIVAGTKATPATGELKPALSKTAASPYGALVRRYGLPDVWTGGVSRESLLEAEPALRLLYISGQAGADSARVRLYLAEAGRLRYETAPDSSLYHTVLHHYWRAIRLAGQEPDVARIAHERLQSFSR